MKLLKLVWEAVGLIQLLNICSRPGESAVPSPEPLVGPATKESWGHQTSSPEPGVTVSQETQHLPALSVEPSETLKQKAEESSAPPHSHPRSELGQRRPLGTGGVGRAGYWWGRQGSGCAVGDVKPTR